ncbi:hypothetical protein NLJ89_g4441 [Agrocybe chaxingu]|uniref:F-box domain-containing protein n=1 Tax=Agrocybe chaxingu TaxID=84603 RepID=A0A9W8K8R0_9AGAR|nr:hypothetical protein NLJ89_g4441 [Agrocybe chaxingu]
MLAAMEGHFSRPEAPWNNKEAKVEFPEILVLSLKDNFPISEELAIARIQEIQKNIEESLIDPETELASIETQIVTLQQRKQEIVQLTMTKWMTLGACKTVLSPIRRIPTEILQEIALHALPSQPHPQVHEAPMSLTHACSTWRKALLALLQAWNELFLELDLSTMNWQWPRVMVRTWLVRAKKLPMSPHLHFDGHVNEVGMLIANFLKGISPWFSRVHHLGLSANMVLECFQFFAKYPTLKPRSLTLNMYHEFKPESYASYTADSQESDGIFAFWNASGLRELYLDEPITFHGVGRRMFPWSQLTVLYFTQAIDLPSWVSLLKLCPQLQKGSFCLSEEDDDSLEYDSDESDAAIEFAMNPVHGHLEDLRISLSDMEIHHKWCFSACRFPRLRMLHVTNDCAPEKLPEVKYPAEFGAITTLALENDWLESPQILEELFAATPSVTKLALMIETPETPEQLKILTHVCQPTDDNNDSKWSDVDSDSEESTVQASKFTLPNLSSLTFFICERIVNVEKEFPIILKTMESMIESCTAEALPSSCRLHKLRVVFTHPNESMTQGLRSLLERYPPPRFDFEVVDLLMDTSPCIDNLEWQRGISFRTSRRKAARAKRVLEYARREQAPYDVFPGY